MSAAELPAVSTAGEDLLVALLDELNAAPANEAAAARSALALPGNPWRVLSPPVRAIFSAAAARFLSEP